MLGAYHSYLIQGHPMANYSDLMAQAKSLMAQAEQARKAELASVINDIKEKMKTYGITVADLGGGAGKKSGKVAKTKCPVSEAWIAICAVSGSRISPIMMTSGS